MGKFTGKVVLITGAASGIGRGIAVAAAGEDPAALHLADVSEGALGELAIELGKVATDVHSHLLDVGDPEATATLFGQIGSPLDIAFLNAGINGAPSLIQEGGTLDTLSLEAWDRVLRTNLDGLFYGLRACAITMKPQRAGTIVVTASTAGLRPEPRVSYPYVASKHAAVGLVRQAALELAPHGVRVNAIAPGPIVTNIGGNTPRSPESAAAWQNTIPLGRWGQVDDVTGLALFLASEDAGWMTGGIHTVDGGAGSLTQVLAADLPGLVE